MKNAMDAFDDLNILMKKGDYEKRLPEITNAVNTLYDLKFLEPAVEVLKEYNLASDRKINYLRKNIYKRAKTETGNLIQGIEKYVVPQKIAAAVIGFIGTFLLLFNLNITGAVIGGDSNITMGIIGVFMVFFALLIYLRPLKKSFKK
jgi:hypothetical protein